MVPSLPKFLTPFNGCSSRFVSEWIRADTREWDATLIRRFFSPETTRKILAIPIGPEGMRDDWKWKFATDGTFSVRSAYHARRSDIRIREQRGSPRENDKIWKWLWNLSLPPKIRYFLWRCIRGALSTKNNLFRRKCSVDSICPVCRSGEETAEHCLFYCAHVWTELFPHLNLPLAGITFDQWIYPCFAYSGRKMIIRLASTLWNIWKARNEVVFKGTLPSTYAHKLKIALDIRMWEATPIPTPAQPIQGESLISRLNHSSPPHSLPCPPPRSSTLVIHCDGSFSKDSQEAAYGVVMTNSHGQVCDGRSGTLVCSSTLVAEASAILEALKLASSRQVTTTIMTDSLTLVTIINNSLLPWPWECAALGAHMIHILTQSPWVTVDFTPRTRNMRADWVANETRKHSLPEDWITVLNDKHWW